MTAREILRAAGLPVGRNAAIDYSERLRVAEYYIWKTDTDDQKIAALIGTADLYQDYRIIRSRGGVHALPGGKIRIESREESDFNYPIIQAAKRDAGRYDNETLTMRNRRIANTRLYVKDVWAGKRGEIHRAARRAARALLPPVRHPALGDSQCRPRSHVRRGYQTRRRPRQRASKPGAGEPPACSVGV